MNVFIQKFLLFTGQFFTLIVLIPGLFLYVVTKITQNSYANLTGAFSSRVALIFGSLGIIIHETAHLLVAKLFGHTIQDFKLIKSSKEDGLLGFVAHAWAVKNKWSVFGNFFIGIAPSFVLGGLMLVDFFYMLDFYSKNFWVSILLGLVLISLSLGLSLSPQDWQTTTRGIPYFLIFFLIVDIIFFLFETKNQVINYLIKLDLLLPYLLAAVVIIWVLIKLITLPFRK